MSKNVKSNNKNIKKSAPKAKKSTRNNYKIESLEPRLMMDADPGFDVEHLNDYAEQIESISGNMGEQVSAAVNSIEGFDASKLGLAESVGSFTTMFGESVDTLKTTIADKVNDVLTQSLDMARTAIEQANANLEQGVEPITKLSLTKLVDTYVKNFLESEQGEEYRGLTFSAEGSRLTVGIDLSESKSLENLGVDLGSWGKVSVDGSANLSAAAQASISVELDKDGSGTFFDSDDDFEITAPQVNKLEISIDIAEASAKFMNIAVSETESDAEAKPDMTLSYAPDEGVTKNVDLEFKVGEIANLPFYVADEGVLKVSTNDGELDVQVPEFKLNKDFSLGTVLKSVAAKKLPILNSIKIPVGSGEQKEEMSVAEFASELEDFWSFVPGAIYGSIENMTMNLTQLKSSIDSFVAANIAEWGDVLDSYAFDVEGNTKALVEGENSLVMQIKPIAGSFDKLNLGMFSLKGVGVSTEINVKFTFNMDAEGKITFGNVALQDLNVNMQKTDIESVSLEGISAVFKNGAFGLELSIVNRNNRLDVDKFDAGLTYDKLDLNVGDAMLASLPQGAFSYANEKWTLPAEITNFTDLLSGESFSLEGLLGAVRNVPYLANYKFAIAKKNPGEKEPKNYVLSVVDFAGKVDEAWKGISLALSGGVNEAVQGAESIAEGVAVDAGRLKALFESVVGTNLSGLFDSVTFKMGETDAVDIFAEVIGEPTELPSIALNVGSNEFTLGFAKKNIAMDGFSIDSFNVNAKADVSAALKIKLNIDQSGKVSFDGFDFSGFDITLSLEDFADASITISYVDGEWLASEFDFESIIEGISLSAVLDPVVKNFTNNKSIPNLDLKVKETQTTVLGILDFVSNTWENVSKALKASVSLLGSGDPKVAKLDADALRNKFASLVEKDGADEFKNIIDCIKIVPSGSMQEYNVWGSELQSAVLPTFTGKEYTFVFSLHETSLDKLKLPLFILDNTLGVDSEIAIKVTIKAVDGKADYTLGLEKLGFGVDIGGAVQGLPFAISGDSSVKVSYDVTNGWKVDYPEFELGGNFALKAAITSLLENVDIPLEFKIGEEQKAVDDLASIIVSDAESAHNAIVQALYSGAAKLSTGATSSIDVTIETLKRALSDVLDSESIFKSVEIVKQGSNAGDSDNLCPVFGEGETAETVLKFSIDDSSQCAKLTFRFTPEKSLENVSFAGVNLGTVDMSCPFDVTLTLHVENDGSINLNGVKFDEMTLELKQQKDKNTISLPGGLSAELEGESFEFKASVGGENQRIDACSFQYDSLKLMYGQVTLLEQKKPEDTTDKPGFSYSDGKWNFPDEITNLENILSPENFLDGIVNIVENLSIPYLGNEFKIGDDSYTISGILNKVNNFKNNVLLALRNQIAYADDNFTLDLGKAKTIVESFVSTNNLGDFFSEINLKFGEENSYDLLAEDLYETPINIDGGVFTVELCPKIKCVQTDLGDFEIEAAFAIEVSVSMDGESVDFGYNFKQFELKAPGITSSSLGGLLKIDDDCLKLTVGGDGEVKISNVELNDELDVSDFLSLDGILEALENINIPFINEPKFSVLGQDYTIKQIAQNLNECWKIAQYGVSNAFADGKLDFNKIKDAFSGYVNGLVPLDKIQIFTKEYSENWDGTNLVDLLGANTIAAQSLALEEGEHSLLFAISPKQLQLLGDGGFNLGIFDVASLSAECTVYLKLNIKVDKDGKLSINNVDLERVDLDFSTSLDSMNLGLFEVEIDGGKVDFSVSIGDGVKPKELKLGYSSLTLKAGDSFELPKITNEDGDNFSYNFDSREWTLPNSIKQYMSLSGDSLINQVHVVLNSLQSALRSLVESKTKLDFLDGSIDKVVDIVDKVEAVVYGDGSENCDFGLMKCVEGQYQKNFGNISTFVEVFNKSWRTVFGVDDNVVSLQPVEGENNIVLLDFALKFGVEKAFGLDLANVLKDKLENISTHGYVSIKADATISFNLKIDFSGEKLEKDAKLSEIGLFELDNEENPTKALREVDGVQKDISVNEWYITYEIPSEKTFDEDLFIKLTSNVKETEGRSELGIVKIKEGVSLSSLRSDWYENSPSETDFEISYTSSRQIVITSKQEFVIEKGDNLDKKTSGGDSFAELKLSGTNLQTMYKVQRDDEWTIHVLKSGEDSPKDVKIKNDFFQKLGDGYIQGKNLKDQLNEYLSIQNTIDEVDKGRSIMNTYGLYVVDVDEDNIIFGCDSRRIQGNLDTDNILYYLYDNGAEYGKKITYMRISGELTPSIGKHGALVASGTNKVFIEFDNAADDVDSVAEKFKDLYKKYVDSDVPDGLGNEFVFTIDSINLKFEKEEKGDAWCISLKSTDGASVEWFDHILELKFSDVNDDSETIYVNTEQCSSVSSLAKAIKDTIDNCTQDDDILSKISSVMVVDGNIVFSVNDEVKIVGTTEEIKADKTDFKIGDKPVDFQDCLTASNLETQTLAGLLENINAQLGSDYTIKIVDDHLEIFGSQEFTLTSFGSSKALEWLGFSSGQKAQKKSGTSQSSTDSFRIVGSALQNLDWSKKISLEEIKLGATLAVSMGTDLHEIEEVRKSGNSVSLKLKSAEGNDVRADVSYAVGGYIAVGDDYYKIENVDVEAGTLTVSTVSIDGDTLDNADKKETWATAKYVASASASYKFVGADLIAKGDVGLELKFDLEKTEKKESNNIFGYKVNPVTLGLVDGSNKFTATAYADLFGYDIELAEVSLEIVKPNEFASFEDDTNTELKQDNYRLASNVELGDGVKSILDSFKNFSIEKLYVVLENLIERIDDVTDKVKDKKIPVINKTVGDLVSVANDLRSIISTLRAEKITSLQQFGDLLNTYLEKFNLSSRTDGKKLFNIRFDKDYQAVFFDFDVVKAIGVRHRFSFGKEDSGVQGNIDLDVSGDFWFALSAKVVFGEEFDLVLTEPIQFGAEIAISGDKLNFDLGVTGGGSGMLSNLISVGENKDQQSFIHGKVAFLGSVSGKDSGSFSINDPKGVKIDYALPIVLFGRLPITVCEMSLGDVLVGRFNNNAVELVNCTSFDNAQDEVEKIMGAIKEDWKDGELTDANKVYDSFDFGLRLGNEDNKSQFDGRLIADFSSVYERILELADFANMDWFSQIKLAVSGLNNLFEMLESNINGGMANSIKSVPVVGSALSTGVDFLSVLKNKVLDPFSKFVYESTGLTAEMVAKKMNDLFGLGFFLTPEYDVGSDEGDSYYFGWNGDKTGWKQVDGKGTWYRSTKESAEWYFNLGGVYEFGTSVGFDLGFPGLALAADGGLNLSLSWALEFGFGISKQNGFYFIFNDGNEINVKATAELDADISASLAGLGLTLSTKGKDKDGNNHKAAVELSFGVDLNNPSDSSAETYDSRLGASEPLDADGVKEWITKEKTNDDPKDKINLFTKKYGLVKVSDAFAVPTFDFEASVNIYTGIDVGVGKDAGRDTPKFPNISGDFEFDWAYEKINEEGDKDSVIKSLAFKNLEFDMGSFIGGVLGPIVSKIQTVIEPLEPLIDFLMTPFPVLDDLGIKITPLDLAKKYSKGKFDDGMILAIKDLISISKMISTSNGTGVKVNLGDFELVKSGPGMGGSTGDTSTQDFLEGKSSRSVINDNIKKYAKGLEDPELDIANKAQKKLEDQGFKLKDDGGWNFIWSDPSKIFQMLLGEDVPLVEYTMPTLCFDFDWNTFVRIWGPLGARLGVTFNASIQLGFGYDTLGIRQWISSGRKDYGRLLNGFYVMDKDKNGVDVNELSFYGGLTAAAELNAGVSAGVGGGVGINVGFNLFDPNKDGKVRLSEMKQIIGELGLFGIFDVNGAITAKLYAYVDLWLTTKKWNITGDITLFSFNYEHKLAPVMASKDENGNIVAHIGPNAGDRVSTDNDNPTLEDGNETYIAELTEDAEVKWGDGKKVSTEKGKWHRINGDAGDDYIKLTGKAGLNLEIYGGEGDDVIDLSELDLNGYTVIIVGGAGNDTIIGANGGMNIIYGDDGYVPPDEDEGKKNGKFYVEGYVDAGAAGNDVIVGGAGNDVIFGGAGNDKIDGLDGDDLIFGDGGKALYDNGTVGGASRSDVSLDGGDDLIIGGKGNDTVFGGSGNDRVDGGAGDDEIHGERGNDRIFGGSGDDDIYGGSGHDIVYGGNLIQINVDSEFSKDFFSKELIANQFAKNNFEVAKSEFSFALDSAKFKDGTDAKLSGEDSDSDGIDHIYGGEGDDLIYGAGGNDVIEGGIGNDVIDGGNGDDNIQGGIDNDIIYGGEGNDVIDGGAGNDSLYGDKGVASGYTKGSDAFNGEKITFGENLGLGGIFYKDAKSGPTDGNDKIKTGPGLDFVDGQGGSDQIFVNLMGGSETSYVNITDSGEGQFDRDVLTIEATEYADNLLMRMNEAGTLGFVALLPEDGNVSSTNANKNIERVNFTNGIDVVNLYANGGDDKVVVDGTAAVTNIDGGAGNDTFQVGQLYNSDRKAGTQNIASEDGFKTIQNSDGKYLSEGVSEGSKLNIDGGVGDDTFTALRNVGSLNMAGSRGNDAFSVYNYKTMSGDIVVNGTRSIDGGTGIDSVNVYGTEGDDTVVITKEGLLSESGGIKVAGVEYSNFAAGAGDDEFYVASNNAGETTTINGGHGNDTVSVGGLDLDSRPLRNADTDGQTNTLTYEVLSADSDDLDDDEKKICFVNSDLEDKKYQQKFVVMDTSAAPAVFVSTSETYIADNGLVIQEGGVGSFFVGYSGNLKEGSITVDLNIPLLSTSMLQAGDRGILIKKDSDTTYSDHVQIVFDGKNTQPVKINVKALSDSLSEEDVVKSISLSSVWTYTNKGEILKKLLSKSATAFSLSVKDDKKVSKNDEAKKLLTRTEEYTIGGSAVALGEFGVELHGANKSNIHVYLENSDKTIEYTSIDDKGVLTIKNYTNDLKDKVLIVNYRSNTMKLDGSKIHLAYDDVASLSSVKYGTETVYCGADKASKEKKDIYYELNGNVLVFFNTSNQQLATLHGEVSVGSGTFAGAETNIQNGDSFKPCDFLTIKRVGDTAQQNQYVLAEKYLETELKDGHHVPTGNTERDTSWNSMTFDITYNKDIPDGKSLFVKVSASEVISKMLDGNKEVQLLIYDNKDGIAKSSVVLEFKKGSASNTITVFAKADAIDEEYGIVTFDGNSDKRINQVEGIVDAYGKGTSDIAGVDNPELLHYNHKIESDSGFVWASKFNEKNTYDLDSLASVKSVSGNTVIVEIKEGETPTKGGTVKFVSEKNESEWFRIDGDPIVGEGTYTLTLNKSIETSLSGFKAMFAGQKDYLFESEDDCVDRIFVNNQDSNVDANSALENANVESVDDSVKFTHTELKEKVVASEFEFGEFNLGTGKDTVNISKTIHGHVNQTTEKEFQTFTVVNTGDDKTDNRETDDDITVTDYNANDGQLVINAQGGNDKITAKGSLITKDGMVVLGGAGNDTIDVDKGIIAFGDKGNIQYMDGNNVVTELGYYKEDSGEHKAGDVIFTTIPKDRDSNFIQKQTDGIARGATSIASVMPNEGGVDKITAGGQMSVVVGGFGGDNISVTGEKNVVLGDNGVVNFHNEGSATSWRENNIKISLEKVQTTNNSIGEKDTIGIVGSHNVVMGGNGDDDITIGEAGKGNGTDNVVLGDGGVANFTPGVATTENFMVNAAVESVKTEEDSVGAGDTIEIYGGQNTVMGGAGADIITIGEENKDDSEEVKINGDENVVLGDGGSYVVDKDKGEVKVHTHDLSVTEDKEPDFVDTITIHGGQNTVMGGVAGDNIDIYGADNIVLGDGGESIREWNADNEVYDSIKSVETTDDSNGGIDTINIHGGKNAVMGGAKGDKITIGDGKTSDGNENAEDDNENQNGNENVVLGDGGSYVVDKDKGEVTVKTSREEVDDTVVIHGGEDTIKIYGGQNTVMGGAMGDGIDIYGADNIVLGDGGIAVREWNSEKKVYEAIKSVKTTDDENGGVDTINIYGGQNAVMGGFDGDNITIGTQNGATSDNNIVLGDGGEYNNEASDSAYIQTQSDGIGGEDHIKVYGGHNVAMGGFADDDIEIHGGENVVLGDGGIANYDKKPDAATVNEFINSGLRYVETTSDDIGGHDDIDIFGDTNVVMGGADGDIIDIAGNDNVVVGDGGRYDIYDTYRTVQTKSEQDGGHDVIHTNDGKNIVMGGMDSDEITTGAGNDIILGDGGFAKVDRDFNAIYVTNEGRNIETLDKDEQVVVREDGTAGADTIIAGNGDNVVFGGLDSDDITTGNGQDVVFGDNAYATFRGNANEAFEQVGDRQNVPDVYEEATLSFNFQGASQTGLNAGDFVGAYNEENGDDYRSSNWNNISGSLAGTYGNDDREVVNMDNLDATGEKSADETRVRASGVSVSYGGIESHRNTSTDNRINLQAYNLGLWNAQYDKNAKLMNSGLMTTAPNAQCENKLDVQMDGLAQYFTSYRVVVYLDIPDSHSAANNSIRKVSLYTNDSEDPIKTFYVKDNAGHNFHGSYERSTAETAASAMEANYVVFMVDEGVAADRIRVVIEEADPNAQNGKNLPGIAAIQVRGTLHKQDVAATTDIDFGGNDTIRTDLGDDIVVGGTGGDDITTFGDERYCIHDNDVVFGDNAKILLTDRDSDESTASTISTAESVAITNIDAIYDDLIKTGNGNDTVVGGVGADTINAEATAAADTMLEDINVLSINFTREHSDSTDAIAQGEAAGVVVDTDWHNFYRNDRGVIVSESVRGQESSPEYNNKMNSLSNNPTASNPYAVEEGVEVQLYGKNHGQRQTVASFTIENYDELDGDTSNSKLFNTYLAAQQSEEIVLKLKNMNSFVSNSNNTVSSTYDLYIYLGGDNNDTDTYNYLYQVKFTGHNGVSQYRYLNDWTGHKFDGDYKEATCSSQSEAERMLQMALNDSAHDSAAPRLELVGNYVVFRGVSGDVADIRIRNIYTSSGQHPKNLPMISAVQVVSGDGRYAGETDLGGDHDKDLVYGDDAKLVFDMDVPYDADVADVSKFKNRVIEAKSVAIEHDAVTSISTNDTITTGRDRDVAVGGEGADTITMGAGDDIALGGSANLVLEHNNPLGVFTPNTEIALDQHTIDTTQHQNYLDNDNANKWQFQSRLDQNLIQGIDTSVSNENDRKDTIDVGEGRNLTSQGSDSTAQLVVPKPVIVDDDGQEGSGEASTPTPPVVAPDDGTVVIDQEGTSTLVEIAAGETVEIVITDWDEGNQYYHPNVFLQLNCSDNTRHKLSVTWDGQQTDPTVYLQNYAEFDIPDVATVVGEHKIVLRITSRDTISLMATVAHR
ncbi:MULTISPECIES: LEPR-XLL domain-containing protein [unclassified Fibrobacter]|uniref:LEPR-XLL domain-containing protein n=1 Tax=unclassified Fibrobacter TaxID=2634177 RepID=UPI0025C651EE|nr:MULTISPECIES: LEPR-XLL domain-containing protein [unclassified Fibrobacter]